jgi:DNA modification methylase
MNIIFKKVDELIPYVNNPRKNDNAVDKVASSIKNYGFKVPIIVDSKNEIIAGHTRLKAAKKLKLKEVPCIIADDLNEQQIKAFRIADNKVGEFAEWDNELLKIELEGLDDMFTGFEDIKFDEEHVENEEAVEDIIESTIEEEPYSKQGYLWELGEHRLLCGDSTKEEDVEKLMNGETINMFFTDPPYSVNYTEKAKTVLKSNNYVEIKNDNLSIEETSEKIWKPVFKNAFNVAENDCSCYITMPQGGSQMMMMMMMMEKEQWQVKHELIWVKEAPVFSMGRLDYDYKHEPILYGWKKKHNFYGKGKYLKSVWEIPRKENKLHPTMKPVELIINCILNSTLKSQNVFDSFLGSGSTLIACEETKRKCFGIELDEHYCDVIVKRYIKFCKDNKKEIDIKLNGEKFNIDIFEV